jgi:hypothetical protein
MAKRSMVSWLSARCADRLGILGRHLLQIPDRVLQSRELLRRITGHVLLRGDQIVLAGELKCPLGRRSIGRPGLAHGCRSLLFLRGMSQRLQLVQPLGDLVVQLGDPLVELPAVIGIGRGTHVGHAARAHLRHAARSLPEHDQHLVHPVHLLHRAAGLAQPEPADRTEEHEDRGHRRQNTEYLFPETDGHGYPRPLSVASCWKLSAGNQPDLSGARRTRTFRGYPTPDCRPSRAGGSGTA